MTLRLCELTAASPGPYQGDRQMSCKGLPRDLCGKKDFSALNASLVMPRATFGKYVERLRRRLAVASCIKHLPDLRVSVMISA